MNPIKTFEDEKSSRIENFGRDLLLRSISRNWLEISMERQYVYNFNCLGRPIIQYPQDIVAMQELIWTVKPDLIIETGIAHGGSLILSASMLAMLDYCEAVETGNTLDPSATQRRVLGLDIDIRPHNRDAITAHPMSHRIDMIQGSSVDPDIISKVHEIASGYKTVMVCLDSNHTHDHVLKELEAYAPLTSKGSYCCVFDTFVEDMPIGFFKDRPWNVSNNPKTAVLEYLRLLKERSCNAADGVPLTFEIDKTIENKLLITVAPDGYLKRVG